jgi:hypothetical protein
MCCAMADPFLRVEKRTKSSITRSQKSDSVDKATTKIGMAGSTANNRPASNAVAPRPTQAPASSKRRITIGGPRISDAQDDQKLADVSRSLPSKVKTGTGAPAVSNVDEIGRRLKSALDLETASTSTQSSKRFYPPTSWRSTPLPSQQSASNNPKESNPWLQVASESDKPAQSEFRAGTAVKSKLIRAETFVPANVGSETQSEDGASVPTRTLSRKEPFINLDPLGVNSDEVDAALDFFSRPSAISKGSALAAPDIAYAHTFHYTQCPHASPPKSRPINKQPTLVKYYSGLLACPPLHLRKAHDKLVQPSIHIIEGSCSDCDMSARRQGESQILAHYTHKLDNLDIQLNLLQQVIIAEHPEIFPKNSKNTISMFALPSTLELLPDAMQAVVGIEDQLNKLIEERNCEVMRIWKGFTARWGPGVRLYQDYEETELELGDGTISQMGTVVEGITSTTSFNVRSTNHNPEQLSISTFKTSMETTSNSNAPPSVPTRSTSRSTRTHTRASSVQDRYSDGTRASSVQRRYSDGTHALEIDSSVDNVKSRGRMIVDWIRPGRRESKQRGDARDLSRTSSQRQK